MAQHDYVIANATGATVRADINSMALAISSNNSGSSEPATMYAYEFWVDSGNNLIKLRNAANNAWITLPLSTTASNTVDVNGGTIDGTTIGASSASTIVGTTVVANTSVNIAGDGATVTGIKDEDNMASNSAVKLATQQSIKAYVDAQVDTADSLAEILAIGNTTSGTNIETTTVDKVQFRDAAIYINSSADGQLDLVADTEIQIAATTIDVNGAMDVSGTVNGLTLGSGNITGSDSANFTINTANSLRINIDSNNSATDQSFIVGNNQTAIDQSNVLFKVQENGRVGIGTAAPASMTGATGFLEIAGTVVGLRLTDTSAANSDWEWSVNNGPLHLYSETTGQASIEFEQNSDVKINNGELYLGNSVYIGGTAAANALDDYEEGTWTPTWTGANSANATYTRIGRVVYASGTFTATGSGTSGDCAGLPYSSTIDGSDGGGSGYHAQDTVTWSVLKISGAGFRFYTGSAQNQLEGANGTRFFLTYNV
tara:strand:+ start:371 stop:1828 length:1458 start_codon:yes stop_codon:yes gene_type:complete